jgi:hypothetical protein
MRVTLTTHGGLAAAITRRLPARVLDTENLPPGEAAELRRLVAAATTDAPRPAPTGSTPARDAMTYTITADDGEQPTTITGSDTEMSPAFAALLAWIEQHTA